MSAEHFGRACKIVGLSTSEKCVLMLLSNHADPDTDEAWPSRKLIAERAGLSLVTVSKVFKSLEDKGYITVTERFRDDRSQSSNLFLVFPNLGGGVNSVKGGGKAALGGGGKAT